MNITTARRTLILNAIRTKGISKVELADKMGRGKPWMTKLLDGTLKSLNDEDSDKIADILGIEFVQATTGDPRASTMAIKITEAIEHCPQLAKVLLELLPLAESAPAITGYIETKDMTRIGQEIIKLAFANEDKPGKVAREVLRILSDPKKR